MSLNQKSDKTKRLIQHRKECQGTEQILVKSKLQFMKKKETPKESLRDNKDLLTVIEKEKLKVLDNHRTMEKREEKMTRGRGLLDPHGHHGPPGLQSLVAHNLIQAPQKAPGQEAALTPMNLKIWPQFHGRFKNPSRLILQTWRK